MQTDSAAIAKENARKAAAESGEEESFSEHFYDILEGPEIIYAAV
jgi:hypothetical protein